LKPGAVILNTTSIQAYEPSENLLPYAATKAAIANITKSLAKLAGKQGVRVNAVAPGPVWTPLIPATMNEEKVGKFGENTVFKRPAQPIEIAKVFVFLASDDSSYISGGNLWRNRRTGAILSDPQNHGRSSQEYGIQPEEKAVREHRYRKLASRKEQRNFRAMTIRINAANDFHLALMPFNELFDNEESDARSNRLARRVKGVKNFRNVLRENAYACILDSHVDPRFIVTYGIFRGDCQYSPGSHRINRICNQIRDDLNDFAFSGFDGGRREQLAPDGNRRLATFRLVDANGVRCQIRIAARGRWRGSPRARAPVAVR